MKLFQAFLGLSLLCVSQLSALTFEQIKANLSGNPHLDTLEAVVDIDISSAAFSTSTSTHLYSKGKEKLWMEVTMPGGRTQKLVRNGNRISATNPATGKEESAGAMDSNIKNPLDFAKTAFDGGALAALTHDGGLYSITLEYGAESPLVSQTFRYNEASNKIVGNESLQRDGTHATSEIEYCTGCAVSMPKKIKVTSISQGMEMKVVIDFKLIRPLSDIPEKLFQIK